MMSKSRESPAPVIYEHSFVYQGKASGKIYSTSEKLRLTAQAYIVSGILLDGYVCYVYDDKIDQKIFYFKENTNPNSADLDSLKFFYPGTPDARFTKEEVDSFTRNITNHSHIKTSNVPPVFLDLIKEERKLSEINKIKLLKLKLTDVVKQAVAKAKQSSSGWNANALHVKIEDENIDLDFNNSKLDNEVLDCYTFPQITVILNQLLKTAADKLSTQDYEMLRQTIISLREERELGNYFNINNSWWSGDTFEFLKDAFQLQEAVDATAAATAFAEKEAIETERKRKVQEARDSENAKKLQAAVEKQSKKAEKKLKNKSQSSSSGSPSGDTKKKIIAHADLPTRINYELKQLVAHETDADLKLIIEKHISNLLIPQSITKVEAKEKIAEITASISRVLTNREKFGEYFQLAHENEMLSGLGVNNHIEATSLDDLLQYLDHDQASDVKTESLNEKPKSRSRIHEVIQLFKELNPKLRVEKLVQSETIALHALANSDEFQNFIDALKPKKQSEPDFSIGSKLSTSIPFSSQKSSRSIPMYFHSGSKVSIASSEYNPHKDFTELRDRIVHSRNITLDDSKLMKAQITEALKLGADYFKRKVELVDQLREFKNQFDKNYQYINDYFNQKILLQSKYNIYRSTAAADFTSLLSEQFTSEDESKQNAWAVLQDEYKAKFETEEIKEELAKLISELQAVNSPENLNDRLGALHKKVNNLPNRQREWLSENLVKGYMQNANVDRGFPDLEFDLQPILDKDEAVYSAYSVGKSVEDKIAQSKTNLTGAHDAFLNGRKRYYEVRSQYHEQMKNSEFLEHECTHNHLIFEGKVPAITQFNKIEVKSKKNTSSDEPMQELDNDIQIKNGKLPDTTMGELNSDSEGLDRPYKVDDAYTGFDFEFDPEQVITSHSEDASHSNDPSSRDSSDQEDEREEVIPQQVLECLNSCKALLKTCEEAEKQYTAIKNEAVKLNQLRIYVVDDMKPILGAAHKSLNELNSIIIDCSAHLPEGQNTKEKIVSDAYAVRDKAFHEYSQAKVIFLAMQRLLNHLQVNNLFLNKLQINSYKKHIIDLSRDFESRIKGVQVKDLQNAVNLASERIEARKVCLNNIKKLSDALTNSRRESEALLEEISKASLQPNQLPDYLADKFERLQSDYTNKITAYHQDVQRSNGELFAKKQKIHSGRLGGGNELSTSAIQGMNAEVLLLHKDHDNDSNLQDLQKTWQENCITLTTEWNKFNQIRLNIIAVLSEADNKLKVVSDRIILLKSKKLFIPLLDCSGAPVAEYHYRKLVKAYEEVSLEYEELSQKRQKLLSELDQIGKCNFEQVLQLEGKMDSFDNDAILLRDKCNDNLYDGDSYKHFFGDDAYNPNSLTINNVVTDEHKAKEEAASHLYTYLKNSSHCIRLANPKVADEISIAKKDYTKNLDGAGSAQDKAKASVAFLGAVSKAVTSVASKAVNDPASKNPIQRGSRGYSYAEDCKIAGQGCLEDLGGLAPDPDSGDVNFDKILLKKIEDIPKPLTFWQKYGGYITGGFSILGGLGLIAGGMGLVITGLPALLLGGAGVGLIAGGAAAIGVGIGAVAGGGAMIGENIKRNAEEIYGDEAPVQASGINHITLPPTQRTRRIPIQPPANLITSQPQSPEASFAGNPHRLHSPKGKGNSHPGTTPSTETRPQKSLKNNSSSGED